jgi:hypothetical protein
VEGDGAYKVIKYIKKLKQSHTTFRTIAYKNRNSDLYIGAAHSSIGQYEIDDVGLHPKINTISSLYIGAATASIVTTTISDNGLNPDAEIIRNDIYTGISAHQTITTVISDAA